MPLTVGIHATVEHIACLRFMLGVNLELMLLFVNLVGYVPVWTLDSWLSSCNILLL